MTEQMHVTLGPRSKPYRCLDCGQEFVWHPGASGLVCATECGACESPNIEALPIEESQ